MMVGPCIRVRSTPRDPLPAPRTEDALATEVDAVSHVKLKDGEAKVLANLLLAVARPRSEDEKSEVLKWIKRLRGDEA